MIDVGSILAPLVPHIETARDTAAQYGEAIIARLDGIHQAVLSEDFQERRMRTPVNITPGMDRWPLTEIGAGEDWMLENWSAHLTAAGPFILRADDEPILAKTLANPQDSGGGNDLVVPGRATITIQGLGPTAGRMYLQWKVRIPAPWPQARRFGGGHSDPAPTGHTLSPQNEHQPAFPLGKSLIRQ